MTHAVPDERGRIDERSTLAYGFREVGGHGLHEVGCRKSCEVMDADLRLLQLELGSLAIKGVHVESSHGVIARKHGQKPTHGGHEAFIALGRVRDDHKVIDVSSIAEDAGLRSNMAIQRGQREVCNQTARQSADRHYATFQNRAYAVSNDAVARVYSAISSFDTPCSSSSASSVSLRMNEGSTVSKKLARSALMINVRFPSLSAVFAI